jgi:hypothetical protein
MSHLNDHLEEARILSEEIISFKELGTNLQNSRVAQKLSSDALRVASELNGATAKAFEAGLEDVQDLVRTGSAIISLQRALNTEGQNVHPEVVQSFRRAIGAISGQVEEVEEVADKAWRWDEDGKEMVLNCGSVIFGTLMGTGSNPIVGCVSTLVAYHFMNKYYHTLAFILNLLK